MSPVEANLLSLSTVQIVVHLCFPVLRKQQKTWHYFQLKSKKPEISPNVQQLSWNELKLPVEVVPVNVGIEMVVEDAWEATRLVPEDVPWAAAPTEGPGPATMGCVETTDAATCVVAGAVAPELVAVMGLAACGVGCPAGTSVALLSGRAMDMRESRRSSFSVSKELRLITGWDSIFIS